MEKSGFEPRARFQRSRSSAHRAGRRSRPRTQRRRPAAPGCLPLTCVSSSLLPGGCSQHPGLLAFPSHPSLITLHLLSSEPHLWTQPSPRLQGSLPLPRPPTHHTCVAGPRLRGPGAHLPRTGGGGGGRLPLLLLGRWGPPPIRGPRQPELSQLRVTKTQLASRGGNVYWLT